MTLRLSTWGWLLAASIAGTTSVAAQSTQFQATEEVVLNYQGGSMAWWKLLLIVLSFLTWVGLADWMNSDAHTHQNRTRLPPHLWNPVVVGAFLIGFLTVLFVPFFLAGFPVFFLGCFAPFVSYVLVRNNRLPDHLSSFTVAHLRRKLRGAKPLVENADRNASGPAIKLEASGSGQGAQTNEIRARQVSDYEALKSLFHDAIVSRADTLIGMRTAKGGQWRKRIDGVWHALPAMEPALAEKTVLGMKHLAGLDPSDRRFPQQGKFVARLDTGPVRCELTVRRDANSESVQVKLIEPKRASLTLSQLGLFPEMVQKLTAAINEAGLTIVSARPGEGLSTTWQAILGAGDRVTKDWVGIVDNQETETQLENIEQYRFNSKTEPYPAEMLRTCLLKQPDALVVPRLIDPDFMAAMLEQVRKQGRIVVTRHVARSAVAALLELMKVARDRRAFIDAVTVVTGQRLARRLCDQCKQPMPTTPEMIKRLGGDPAKPPTIYRQYTKPDPPPVDKKGRPIEIPPCSKCTGVGYYGRVALMEVILVDDAVRQALAKKPDEATIASLGLTKWNRSSLQQGFLHVLAGTTSVAEIQRVFKESK